jgi:hypothetical protein
MWLTVHLDVLLSCLCIRVWCLWFLPVLWVCLDRRVVFCLERTTEHWLLREVLYFEISGSFLCWKYLRFPIVVRTLNIGWLEQTSYLVSGYTYDLTPYQPSQSDLLVTAIKALVKVSCMRHHGVILYRQKGLLRRKFHMYKAGMSNSSIAIDRSIAGRFLIDLIGL